MKMKIVGKIEDGIDVHQIEKETGNVVWVINNEKFEVEACYPCKIKITNPQFMDYGKVYNATRYDSVTQTYYLVFDSFEDNIIYLSEDVEEIEEKQKEVKKGG